jgi:hypothetical protein
MGSIPLTGTFLKDFIAYFNDVLDAEWGFIFRVVVKEEGEDYGRLG